MRCGMQCRRCDVRDHRVRRGCGACSEDLPVFEAVDGLGAELGLRGRADGRGVQADPARSERAHRRRG